MTNVEDMISKRLKHTHVAQMALSRDWGGLEMMTLRYAVDLKERGYKSYIITLTDSPLEKKAWEAGLTTLSLPKSVYFSPTSTYKLRKFIKTNCITFVMIHHLRDLWLVCPAVLGLSVELMGFCHMFLDNVNKKDFLHRWLYSRLKNVIALTEVQKRSLLKCLPLNSMQISVLPNGVDTKKFNPSKRSQALRQSLFSATENQFVVGVIGRLDPQKGQLEFLQSACLVIKKYPQVIFALIGNPNRDGLAYLEELKSFSRHQGLTDSVRFIPHLEDVSSALASLDVFVLPSYQETFGNVVVEAMASGVPIIATAAGGLLQMIDQNENGLLVPPKDPAAMAEAIQKVIENRTFSGLIARKSLGTVQKKYLQEKVLNQIEAVMQNPNQKVFFTNLG
ncbi:MAG: glycosyltransferase family 4 protein [Bdellovibrionales bacterium]|nr:glycosyltransferase family 4 protein [Bdellovibrionales bacterium]